MRIISSANAVDKLSGVKLVGERTTRASVMKTDTWHVAVAPGEIPEKTTAVRPTGATKLQLVLVHVPVESVTVLPGPVEVHAAARGHRSASDEMVAASVVVETVTL